jgi:hypothetical protein
MDYQNPADNSRQRHFRRSSRVFYGKRGLVVLALFLIAMAAMNFLVWFAPIARRGTPAPPNWQLEGAIAFLMSGFCFAIIGFMSLWTHLSPPPKDSPSYVAPNLIVFIGGFVGLLLRVIQQ